MPRLHELSLQGGRLSPRLLVEIGDRCTNLRVLQLEFGRFRGPQDVSLYRVDLEYMLHRLSTLESLTLSMDGQQLDSQLFEKLPQYMGPLLKVLHVRCMAERDARQIANVCWEGQTALIPQQGGLQQSPRIRTVGCRNLQSLSLLLNRITDTLMTILTENLISLTELDLQDEPSEEPPSIIDLSNWGVQQIGSCTMLRCLSLIRMKTRAPVFFKRVNDIGILIMAEKCKNLESIRLGGFSQVTDAGLNVVLHSCPNLHTFELVQMVQISDLMLHNFPTTSHSLVSVKLGMSSFITNDSLLRLACCVNLKILNLDGCRSVGDAGLKPVSGLPKLAYLVLDGADVSDFGLSYLGSGIAPLVSLSLRGCKRLTDKGVSALLAGSCHCTLESLDLSCIPAMDDQVILILIRSGMKIVYLRLRDCHRLTDASVMALASMQSNGRHGGSLRLLDLWNNKFIMSVQWFMKPYFSRLRWLGLGRHLKKASKTLARDRPLIKIFWQGCELNCPLEEWKRNLFFLGRGV